MRNKNPHKKWLQYNGTLFIFTSILNSHGKLPDFIVLKQENEDEVRKEKFTLVIKVIHMHNTHRKTITAAFLIGQWAFVLFARRFCEKSGSLAKCHLMRII